MNSLNCFCDPCSPSPESFTDISCRPHFCCFLPSFLCCYLFSKCNIHFFILVFSDPTSLLFSVFLFLCSTFPVFYFLPFSSVCLSLHILNFLFLSFLSVFYFLSCCLLSFSSNFLCLPSNFSFCFYLFLCLLLPFFAFFHFHSLLVFYSILLTLCSSFYLFLHLCVCFVVVIIIIIIAISIIIAIIIFMLLFFFVLFFLPIF